MPQGFDFALAHGAGGGGEALRELQELIMKQQLARLQAEQTRANISQQQQQLTQQQTHQDRSFGLQREEFDYRKSSDATGRQSKTDDLAAFDALTQQLPPDLQARAQVGKRMPNSSLSLDPEKPTATRLMRGMMSTTSGKPVTQELGPDSKIVQEFEEFQAPPKPTATAGSSSSSTVKPPANMTPNQAIAQTRSLRNDFVRETSAAKMVNQQYSIMQAGLEAAKGGGSLAAASQAILVTFQKILDPTSVVRESEYARSASGLAFLTRLEGQWLKLREGGAGVPLDELEKFVALAGEFTKRQNAFAMRTKTQLDKLATRFGLDPELITSDFDDEDTPPAQAQGGAAGAGPKVGETRTVNGETRTWNGTGWVKK